MTLNVATMSHGHRPSGIWFGLVCCMVFTVSWVRADEVPADIDAIVVESAKSATLPQLAATLGGERLVYVGETHTAYADHLLQLAVLRGMATDRQGLAIGVEWFQRRFQPVLDDYLAGRIDEAAMLRGTEYFDRWRFDYRLYRPIMRFARDNGIPVIALNASAELTGEIRKVGVDALTGPLRSELPASYDFSDKDYEASLHETFRLHQAEDRQFQRFLEVQLTWDETMAERVSAYLDEGPGNRMLVLAGRGHIAYRHGIPNRVTRRTGLIGKTVATLAAGIGPAAANDYLVLTDERQLPPAGLMHVLLDDDGKGVLIKGFTPDSPAEAAGVRDGDQLLSIDGAAVERFADVKIAMIDRRPGDEVVLQVRRKGLFGRQKTVDLRFKLSGEALSLHH